jgi:cysteine-rich repeat protein
MRSHARHGYGLAVSLGLSVAACDGGAGSGGVGGTGGTGGAGGGGGTAGAGGLGGAAGAGGSMGGAAGAAGSGGEAGSGGIGGAGGSAGAAGSGGSAGQGGGLPGTCGDGAVDLFEDCDGVALGGYTCGTLGYATGALSCAPGCAFDASACNGEDPCAAPLSLADPAAVSTSSIAAANGLDARCSAGPTGPERVFEFVASESGVLDVAAFAGFPGALSVRATCGGAAVACAAFEQGVAQIELPIDAGDTVYLVVESDVAGGAFELDVVSRAVVCGDFFTDLDEACDDGNLTAGDGCSPTCDVESNESEPNDTFGAADAFVYPFFGQLSTPADVDFVSFDVPASPTEATIVVYDYNGVTCPAGLLDAYLELYDDTGALLASDDNSGDGLCPRLVVGALAAGTYTAAVSVGSGAGFAYVLQVDQLVEVCGDGVVSLGEGCDDGNSVGGDGCSAGCQFEVNETEPNDALATADDAMAGVPWYGLISPVGDVDVVAVQAPLGATLVASATDIGDFSCDTGQLDTFVEILAPGPVVLASDDDSGSGACAFAAAGNLAAGTYYVRVKAGAGSSTFPYRLEISIL